MKGSSRLGSVIRLYYLTFLCIFHVRFFCFTYFLSIKISAQKNTRWLKSFASLCFFDRITCFYYFFEKPQSV